MRRDLKMRKGKIAAQAGHACIDAISSAFEGEECDNHYDQIADICDVFKTRELTLFKLLEMYEKMYDDIQAEEAKKVNLIKSAFDNNMSFIEASDISGDDKYAALGYVTDKIAELVEKSIVKE